MISFIFSGVYDILIFWWSKMQFLESNYVINRRISGVGWTSKQSQCTQFNLLSIHNQLTKHSQFSIQHWLIVDIDLSFQKFHYGSLLNLISLLKIEYRKRKMGNSSSMLTQYDIEEVQQLCKCNDFNIFLISSLCVCSF